MLLTSLKGRIDLRQPGCLFFPPTPDNYAAALCFILAWSDLNYALFLTARTARTVPTAIAFFCTERGILWGEVSALGVIGILPVLVIAALGHKVLLRGFSIEGSQQ
jgi:ABC-type glycerol-3-phosphate transport system permease component